MILMWLVNGVGLETTKAKISIFTTMYWLIFTWRKVSVPSFRMLGFQVLK